MLNVALDVKQTSFAAAEPPWWRALRLMASTCKSLAAAALLSGSYKFDDVGEVIEKAGKAFTDTGKVGKKFNPDHPDGTAGRLQ